jgi:hypothetical protein
MMVDYARSKKVKMIDYEMVLPAGIQQLKEV